MPNYVAEYEYGYRPGTGRAGSAETFVVEARSLEEARAISYRHLDLDKLVELQVSLDPRSPPVEPTYTRSSPSGLVA